MGNIDVFLLISNNSPEACLPEGGGGAGKGGWLSGGLSDALLTPLLLSHFARTKTNTGQRKGNDFLSVYHPRSFQPEMEN